MNNSRWVFGVLLGVLALSLSGCDGKKKTTEESTQDSEASVDTTVTQGAISAGNETDASPDGENEDNSDDSEEESNDESVDSIPETSEDIE